MKLTKAILPALTLLIGMFMSVDARADGVLTSLSALDAAERRVLSDDIALARRDRPDTFNTLAGVRDRLAEMDANKRGPLAVVTPILKAMGDDGVLPMLAEVAVDADPQGDLTDSAWSAWRIALLEALGARRDPRTEAVLTALLDVELERPVRRAAVQAYAKLASDAVVSTLISRGDDSVVLEVMGHCRRTAIAEHLAGRLVGASAADAHRIARALGDVGSAWAWETPVVAASGEAADTRFVAADALVHAFTHQPAAVRGILTQAVLVVDHPDTPSLIATAKKGVDAERAAALDELQRRFDASPLHR